MNESQSIKLMERDSKSFKIIINYDHTILKKKHDKKFLILL